MNTGEGKELTDKDEKEKELIESENDTGKEDWEDSLERKRISVTSGRKERRGDE